MHTLFDSHFAGLQIDWHNEEHEIEFLGSEALSGSATHVAAQCRFGRSTLAYLYPVDSRRDGDILTLEYKRNPVEWPQSAQWEVVQGRLTIRFRSADSQEPRSVEWWNQEQNRSYRLLPDTDWIYRHSSPAEVLVEPRGRLPSTRLARDGQAVLRSQLLADVGACEVTGTDLPEVLQACHILPVKNGGKDCLSNALLLRADIHLLFDSGRLNFERENDQWRVRVLGTHLPQEYKALEKRDLNDSRLSQASAFIDARSLLQREA